MKRTIRWSVLMAILGFILGLGFLIPIPTYETREPASADLELENKLLFRDVDLKAGRDTLVHPENTFQALVSPIAKPATIRLDRRKDVLFDIHTISESAYAKNTDAYVVAWFRDETKRDEIDSFTYCHNYDYSAMRARTDLDRITTKLDDPKKAFPCYTISLERLKRGTSLIESFLGPIIALKSEKDFDPKKGGTLSIIFAYKVRKIGYNDYRVANLKVTLKDKSLKITGPHGTTLPGGSDFYWLNLLMSQDTFGFPNGVNSISFFGKGAPKRNYPGDTFSEADRPEN